MTSERRDPKYLAPEEGERLQKVLSKAGVASRRVAEDMIAEGRVDVDGETVTELGRRVDPEVSTIHVDGMRIVVNDDENTYLLLNKPAGILSSMSDDQGRPCLGDYLPKSQGRLFHVGRLDMNTEGLLLLTSDGELAHRLMHPSYEVLKTYIAEVPGPLPKGLGRQLREEGVRLEDGLVKLDRFKIIDMNESKALVQLSLHEGRKRVVRRLLKEVGHPVSKLVRTAVGEVKLTNERPGAIRPLDRKEIGTLYKAVGM
jgi:23S rRNA pseudouridine2605 synthase